MSSDDKTKEVLEGLLKGLYAKQAESITSDQGGSYLKAQDGQFLGKITSNPYDRESILNTYGPYGSPYSQTSVFNEYSKYGSPYGQQSINNPYCATPPQLFINGKFLGHVSKNPYASNKIPTEGFIYTLNNDLESLLSGRIIESEVEARSISGDSFIQAADGTFLGSLKPNKYDEDSIFNRYGPYGSRYSDKCIFNKFSEYGGSYSHYSPYNSSTTTPPQIHHAGKPIAYLSVNASLSPRVHPDQIMDWATKNVRKY